MRNPSVCSLLQFCPSSPVIPSMYSPLFKHFPAWILPRGYSHSILCIIPSKCSPFHVYSHSTSCAIPSKCNPLGMYSLSHVSHFWVHTYNTYNTQKQWPSLTFVWGGISQGHCSCRPGWVGGAAQAAGRMDKDRGTALSRWTSWPG